MLTEVVYRYDVNTSLFMDQPVYGYWAVSPIIDDVLYPLQGLVDDLPANGRCVLLRILIVDDDSPRGSFREEIACEPGSTVVIEGPTGEPIGAIMIEGHIATGVGPQGPMTLYPEMEWAIPFQGVRTISGSETDRFSGPVIEELAPFNGTITWLYHGEVEWRKSSVHGRPASEIAHAGPMGPRDASTQA